MREAKDTDMDCPEVKSFLSAYFDDELSSDERSAVAHHLANCHECSRELEGFHNLSAMAGRLAHPETPAHIWEQIEVRLDGDCGRRVEHSDSLSWLAWTRRPTVRFGMAIAASIMIIFGWLGYAHFYEHGADHQMAAVFGEYLEEFRRDPGAAQQILLANYEGQSLDAEQVVHTVGYRPVVANGMPEDYSVRTTYVMKMPCCTCVQCLCQRSDGSTIAIFEHDDTEPEWFGDRPESEAICNGTQCSLVQMSDRIAATWQHGKRHITVVGARDKAEVDRLVAWFDERGQRL